MHTSFGLQPQLSITLTMDSGLHCLRREIRDEWRKRERDAMKIRDHWAGGWQRAKFSQQDIQRRSAGSMQAAGPRDQTGRMSSNDRLYLSSIQWSECT